MNLSLVISLDTFADSFVEALLERTEYWPRARSSNREGFWYKAADWIGTAPLDHEKSLEKLGDDILSKLNNRNVELVDIVVILSPGNSEATALFLPLQHYLEQFLPVPTMRRIYAIYPRRPRELAEFYRNFKELKKKMATLKYALRESNLMIAPQEASGGSIAWPKYQIEACAMVNNMPECRSKLDEFLTNHNCTTISYGYSRCVFHQQLWRNYFVLRCKKDLTEREAIQESIDLDLRAAELISQTSLIGANYSIESEPKSLPKVTIKTGIESDYSREPLSRSYEKLREQQDCNHAKILDAEKPQFDRLRATYCAFLVDILDQNPTSLAGFEKALYLHKAIVSMLINPYSHQKPLGTLINTSMVPVLNHLIDGVKSLSEPENVATSNLENLPRQSTKAEIHQKSEQIRNAVQAGLWRGEKLCIKSALLRILQGIGKMLKYSSALAREDTDEETGATVECSLTELLINKISKVLEEPIAMAIEALDDEFNKLKQQYEDNRKSLDGLATEYGLLQKVMNRISYHEKKRAMLNEIEATDRRCVEWAKSTNIFILAVEPLLTFCERLRLVMKLLQERLRTIEETGRFLIAFDRLLTKVQEDIGSALSLIPDGTVEEDDLELSFLSKSDMEQLYSRFGQATTGDYIPWLLRDSGQSWGKWATSHLLAFVTQLDRYCEERFDDRVPMLDLPKLMFDYFPNLVEPRVRRLVRIAAEQLIPLARNNLRERWYHMMFGFPQDCIAQLKAFDPSLTYTDISVSTNPTQVVYVANDDPMTLELTMSVCGFCMKDYIYKGAFEKDDKVT